MKTDKMENLTGIQAPVTGLAAKGAAACICTEEPCWGVAGKCVTCGLSVKQPPDWDVDDRLDELEMTPEEIESFSKPFKTKMQPNLDFPE